MTLVSPGYIFTSCKSYFLCVSCHTFTIFVVSVGLCSCSTCCWTDFRFCQQDLRQHGTWGSHGGTGWPASPDLQNLEKKKATSTERSGEKRHYHHVLSCCNYTPLCMPINSEYIHIVCHTSTHTTSCVCMYVCLFQPCICTTYTLASVLCTLSRDDASLSPNPSRAFVGKPVSKSKG